MKKNVQKNGLEAPPGIEKFFRIGLLIGVESRDLAVKLLHLIRGYGIYKIKPSISDKSNYIDFLEAVHDGWKLAQNLIADKLICNLNEIEDLEKSKKQYHQQRLPIKKSETISKIRKLKLENLIFRRFIDSIVWGMLDNEHSTIRRLPIKKSGDNLSIKNIEDARYTVDEYNKAPLTIAIISDMTTFVHHGDIIARTKTGIKFIELKSGKKGLAITRTAEAANHLKCAIANEILTKRMNTTDKNQFTRIKNQIERGDNLSSTLKNNIGTDHLTGLKIQIGESKVEIKYYDKELIECRRKLEENGKYGISVIDDCLYIGMYKTSDAAYMGFTGWMQVIECKSKIYNITDSFYDPLSRPLPSLYMPTEFVIEIMKGEIIMIACLDIQAFYKLSQTIYPNMVRLTTPSNRVGLEEMLIKGKALTMKFADDLGNGYLGDGLITRMAFDLQTPSSILKMQYAHSDHYYYLNEPTE